MRRAAVLGVAFLAILPAGARASRVRVDEIDLGGKYGTLEVAIFKPGKGERNDVTVGNGSFRGFRIADVGAPLSAGAHCAARGAHAAFCESSDLVSVELGALDDRVRLSDDGGDAAGGQGDDTLVGGAFIDRLDGDAGEDTILAGRGDDVVAGDRGVPYDDVLRGGAGDDTLDYGRSSAPVTVDLTAATAGASGEHDSFDGFEGVVGSEHDDTLIGDDGSNRIDSGAQPLRPKLSGPIGGGADHIVAAGGNDVVTAGPGSDVSLGRGNDLVDAYGHATVRCGPGNDLGRYERGAVVFYMPGCELRETAGYFPSPVRGRVVGRRARFSYACQALRPANRCRGRMWLYRAGRRLVRVGSVRFRARGGRTAHPSVRLGDRALELARSASALRVRVRYRVKPSPYDPTERDAYETLIRAPAS